MTRDEMAVRMRLLLPTLHRGQQHEVTHKAYFKAVNRALEYINSHLDESITLYCLAQVAGITDFHFHRLFRAVMRESPGEYITRLRLE
mgnify:CR=1 FL=1